MRGCARAYMLACTEACVIAHTLVYTENLDPVSFVFFTKTRELMEDKSLEIGVLSPINNGFYLRMVTAFSVSMRVPVHRTSLMYASPRV